MLQLTNPCLQKLSMNAQPHEQKDSKQASTASHPHTMVHLERNSINYSLVYSGRSNAFGISLVSQQKMDYFINQ